MVKIDVRKCTCTLIRTCQNLVWLWGDIYSEYHFTKLHLLLVPISFIFLFLIFVDARQIMDASGQNINVYRGEHGHASEVNPLTVINFGDLTTWCHPKMIF